MTHPTLSRTLWCVPALAATLIVVPLAASQSTRPATSATTSLSTSPTTANAPDAPTPVTFEGYLAPIDPFEVKVKLQTFAGKLKVKQVVPHGSAVRTGDLLIAFETTDIDDAILAATGEVEVARANLVKQESDVKLGDRADAMSLEEKTDAVADAEAAVAWWKKQDGPFFVKQLDLQVKAARDNLEDQGDELEQLRKMYKSEELTNATADIVVKRALRQFEQTKEMVTITQGTAEKQKATALGDQEQAVQRALAAAKHSLEELKASTAQSKVTRGNALLQARAAARAAEKKLSELEKDKAALTVKAKSDGVALFGAFTGGAWQGSEAKAIEVGEDLDASRTIITVIQPGKLKAVAKVDESQVFKVGPGQRVSVKPKAIADLTLQGKTLAMAPLTSADGNYEQPIEIDGVDPRLMPGMKVTVTLEEGR